MKGKIDWSLIKNGHTGFENLAVLYVQTEFEPAFERTKETRDGNKDAVYTGEYTIILGYRSSEYSNEEWWMEAKYSESSVSLTRYRLDATLVSAILKGNVGRIFFVTNININAQTINDIRQAIVSSTVCKDVHFCTQPALEYWLYNNPDILKDFFNDQNFEDIELQNLIIVDPLEFFSADNSGYIFKESLQVLNLGERYCGSFAVLSQNDQTVCLKTANGIKGIVNKKPKKWNIHSGINYLEFSFTITANYGYKSSKKQNEHFFLPAPSFMLNDIELVPKNNININTDIIKHFIIPSQKEMEESITQYFKKSQKHSGTNLFYIWGQSGVGKSYVIDKYIKTYNKLNKIYFICEMSGNYKNDLDNLIMCINYIYFPFLPTKSITKDYLDQLNDNYYPTFYYDLVTCGENEIELSQKIYNYISESVSLFPCKFCINNRFIVVDNIHKANNLIINALYKIIIELSRINSPCNFIFSGQYIQHTQLYSLIPNIQCGELKITFDDCIALLPFNSIDEKVRSYFNSNFLFTNMIELMLFTIYLQEQSKVISDFDSFKLTYNLFFHQNVIELYIKRLFSDAVVNSSKAKDLCNKIYWSTNGLDRTDTEEEKKLLCLNLIKYTSSAQKVIPYHDIYTKFYRKNFICNQLFDAPFVQVLESGKYNEITKNVEKIHNEYKNKNYILVYYTLEPIYKNEENHYRNLMDDTTYYTLFFEFAHSCAFCSIDYSGGILFHKIYNETNILLNSSVEIQKVRNSSLWELTNSTFESLDYKLAENYCKCLLEDTKRLISCGIFKEKLKDSVRYHNINVIKSIIKSELSEADSLTFFKNSEKKMNNNIERLWSFRVRYSLTLLQRDINTAVNMLSDCCTYYTKSEKTLHKYYLWSKFYLSYVNMIIDKTDHLINENIALTTLEEIKNLYFNDYRKMLFGIILYFYYIGQIEKADLYLLKDSYVLRKKRPRLKGFEHIILAFRYVLLNDNDSAIGELEKAHLIFKNIYSYDILIQHNIRVIEKHKKMIIKKYEYYLGGIMNEDTYYLEIRACW